MKLRIVASFAVAASCWSSAALAQGITAQQAEEILKELRAMRQAVETLAQQSALPQPASAARPAADERVKLSNIGRFSIGRDTAPLTIVEFTDLQCPFCNRFATTTFDELKTNYIDTGKVRFVTRDLPLPMHPHAQRAAVAARCAGEQNKFWELRSSLVRNASQLNPEFINASARQLNLQMPAFDACLQSGKFDAEIQKDMADASSVGITGTPSFVIGPTTGTSLEGVRLVGAQPFGVFDARLKQLLEAKK